VQDLAAALLVACSAAVAFADAASGSIATTVPSSSTPAISWPTVTAGSPIAARCRSEPQIPADVTFTRTPSPGAGSTPRTSTVPGPLTRTARTI
jgi:hypothetical protein